MASVYKPNTPSDSWNIFEANKDISLCKRCTYKSCNKRLDRAKKKGKKQAPLDTIVNQFLREDLIDFLDKYWETLKLYGLFMDQSCKPFNGVVEINGPAYVQRRQYHLILRYLETEGDLPTMASICR